ncbi:MAG: SMP-30/gluconolaconase/LRE domain protein [Bacteroidetes bacterium QH_2_67_10]|nr:MAG: SMP-30/gluconolaconase/LRE domain protein [Bacteroidetes bacterium QH_2_67_10]
MLIVTPDELFTVLFRMKDRRLLSAVRRPSPQPPVWIHLWKSPTRTSAKCLDIYSRISMPERVECVTGPAATLGESPVWDPERGVLWWVDIVEGAVHRFAPEQGAEETIDIGPMIGALALMEGGALLLATTDGFLECDPGTGEAAPLEVPVPIAPGLRFNDGKCDPAGRFWVGTMHVDALPERGALYCLAPGSDAQRKEVQKKMAPTTISNVPEEMGTPDGMTIDREGALWVAHWGGSQVVRWDPARGEALRRVPFPVTQVSSCTFGGPRLDRLYVTSARKGLTEKQREEQLLAGRLFRFDPGVSGWPVVPFGG